MKKHSHRSPVLPVMASSAIILALIFIWSETNTTLYPDSPESFVPIVKKIEEIKVAFIGDQGLNDTSKAVLQLIKSEKAEAVFHQGDFEYADDPQAWENQINEILGKNFPYFSTMGNHELKAWNGYGQIISERMSRIKADCTGVIATQSDCVYKNISYISVAPGIFKSDYPSYLAKSLQLHKDMWNICSWHKNQKLMQLGAKQDEVGWAVYETCREAGAIIATAHEHSYSRSYVMDNIEHQHVVSTSSILQIAPGKTFVFVSGLGGESIRPQVLYNPWWGGVYSSTQNANPGALFCTFNIGGNTNKASCYFKDIKGNVPDRFEIMRS